MSGDIGGGKSSVARILSASLGYPIISAGGMQREIAASMGLTTLQLNEQSAKDRSVDDRIGPAHVADGLRLRQVLGNFLSNAIKFTEAGMVDQQAFHATGTQTLDEPQHPRPAIRRPHSNTLRSVFDTKMPNARGSTQAWQIRCR